MAVARKLGVITYRSALEWDGRFGRVRLDPDHLIDAEPFAPEFEIEGYLASHARRFVRTYDPNCYLYLSRSMDWFDLGEDFKGGADEALYRAGLDRALVIGVHSDILFPLQQQARIANGLRAAGTDARLIELPSPQGHDAFLVDIERFGPPIREFLSGITESKASRWLLPNGSIAKAVTAPVHIRCDATRRQPTPRAPSAASSNP